MRAPFNNTFERVGRLRQAERDRALRDRIWVGECGRDAGVVGTDTGDNSTMLTDGLRFTWQLAIARSHALCLERLAWVPPTGRERMLSSNAL